MRRVYYSVFIWIEVSLQKQSLAEQPQRADCSPGVSLLNSTFQRAASAQDQTRLEPIHSKTHRNTNNVGAEYSTVTVLPSRAVPGPPQCLLV